MASIAAAYIAEAPNLAVCVERMFGSYADCMHIGTWDASEGAYRYCSYEETYAEVKALSVALETCIGIRPRECIGVMCGSRSEWLSIDFASAVNDHTVVGLHHSWSEERISHIASETEVAAVFFDDLSKLDTLRHAAPEVRHFVYVEPKGMPATALPDGLLTYTELLRRSAEAGTSFVPPSVRYVVGSPVAQGGRDTPQPRSAVAAVADGGRAPPGLCVDTSVGELEGSAADDRSSAASVAEGDGDSEVFTVMYSSGTTGAAKGVATPKSTWRKTNCNAGPLGSVSAIADRRTVSYMSLCHGADRGVCWFTSMSGGCVSFVTEEENTAGFFLQLQAARPTFFLGMSCTWQDLYGQYRKDLMARLSHVIREKYFDRYPFLLRHGAASLRGLHHNDSRHLSDVYDAYLKTRSGHALVEEVSSQYREKLGGALLIAVTGGGPTPEEVFAFVTRCLSDGNECRAVDSYGSTEFPGISSNGEISGDIELKLAKVSNSHSRYNPPVYGEILVRRKDGHKTMYYKNDGLTSECWDDDGWYHTGDVGHLSHDPLHAAALQHAAASGAEHDNRRCSKKYLRIVDRVKNLEEIYHDGDSVWIEPSRLEGIFASENGEHGIHHVVCVCDRNREGVGLVIEAAGSDKPALWFHEAMLNIAAKHGLRTYEHPIGVAVETSQRWTADAGLLTVSGKVNRRAVKEAYFSQIGCGNGGSAPVLTPEVHALIPKEHVTSFNSSSTETSESHDNEGGKGMTPAEFLASLREALAYEAASTPHSLAQLHASHSTSTPLPTHKKGSRKVFLETVNEKGEKRTIDTAQGKDWLVGRESLVFLKVSDLDVDQEQNQEGRVAETDISDRVTNARGAHPHQKHDQPPQSPDCPDHPDDDGVGMELTKLDSIGYNDLLLDSVPRAPDLATNCVLEVFVDEKHLSTALGHPDATVFGHSPPTPATPVVEVLSGTRTALYLHFNAFEPLRVTMDRVASTVGAPLCALRFGAVSIHAGRDTPADLPPGASPSLHASSIATLLVSRDHSQLKEVTPYYSLPDSDADLLNQQFQRIVSKALVIRRCNAEWNQEKVRHIKSEAEQQERELEDLRREVSGGVEALDAVVAAQPPAGGGGDPGASAVEVRQHLRDASAAIAQGKERIVRQSIRCAETSLCPAAQEAWKELDAELVRLRVLGDALDVDTRALPVTWRLNVDWIVSPDSKETVLCMFGCGRTVYTEELEKHSNSYDGPCVPDIGVASEEDVMATTLGGDQSVVCEITGHLIDAEAVDMTEAQPNQCPERPTERLHSLDSSLDRLPDFHAVVTRLWDVLSLVEQRADAGVGASPSSAGRASPAGSASGSDVAALRPLRDGPGKGFRDTPELRGLLLVSRHHAEAWVRDKQHIFWLHKFVCAGRDIGEFDTPASLLSRACSAFEHRHCLGVSCRDIKRARQTPPLSLPLAAGLQPAVRNNFAWVTYQGLWAMVRPVALHLRAKLPKGSPVLIAGYNDIEWIVVDFACAVAGMTSVGLHTTVPLAAAASIANTAGASCLCAMGNLWAKPQGVDCANARSQWSVPELLGEVALKLVVSMDVDPQNIAAAEGVEWMHDWVRSPPEGGQELDAVYRTGGLPWRGNCQKVDGSPEDEQRITTLLPTSGTTGTPKLVAVSGVSFCADISGDTEERAAISKSLTISYIPLSHSSDRYKMWQHVAMGGRVALCFYAAHHWSAHETSKKALMLNYSSPVTELFDQVSDVSPTSMACPPNIWAGLHEKYCVQYRPDEEEPGSASDSPKSCVTVTRLDKAIHTFTYIRRFAKAVFGPRIETLATGGSPTPRHLLEFATALGRAMNASFVDSYGATECGAITSNGNTEGSKFDEVKILLLNRPDLGLCGEGSLTQAHEEDNLHVRGEVAVQSPSVAVGYYGSPAEERHCFLRVGPSGVLKHPDVPDAKQPKAAPGVWYLTGDVAEYHPSTGHYALIDRVNAIVSTKGGAIVVSGLIENLLETDAGVRQCLVHATPDRSCVFILIVPSSARSPEPREGHQPVAIVRTEPMSEAPSVFDDSAIYIQLRKKLLRKVRRVVFGVTSGTWAAANGLLNGELKKRRGEIKKRYSLVLQKTMEKADQASEGA